MGKVIPFTGVTKLDVPVDIALERAKGELEEVVLLGFDKDGCEYFASSIADGRSVLWLLERCKKQRLELVEEL